MAAKSWLWLTVLLVRLLRGMHILFNETTGFVIFGRLFFIFRYKRSLCLAAYWFLGSLNNCYFGSCIAMGEAHDYLGLA